jgi:hypothetical protein
LQLLIDGVGQQIRCALIHHRNCHQQFPQQRGALVVVALHFFQAFDRGGESAVGGVC